MTHKFTSIEELFKAAGAPAAQETQEKQAEEAPAEESAALEAEFYAAGCLAGEGFADRALEKIAAVAAAGAGTEPRSTMESIAAQIHARRGKAAKVGDDTSIRAEGKAKGHGSDTFLSGKAPKTAPAQYRG